ncbi:MAG TPA: tripartite tricarboxylate transporter substrate binding protein [Burkholderiales bacterium]|nr:tripartite tricarboxylate transporter substrate binding protein [Burkholderiales bacterium]
MRFERLSRRVLCFSLAFASCIAFSLHAQTYPAKPLRLVVGFPAGGPTDIVSRTIAPKMSEGLAQTVLVDNRGGAGGVIATEQVAKAPSDGYTLLMGTIGGIAVAMSLVPNRGYDTLRDLAPITQAVTVTNLLVVHPSVPAKNVKDLLAIARSKPGRLNYASSGNGTVTHLAGELFKLMGKVDITHVPFKGGAPALTALISGEVDLSYENSLVVVPHVKAGKVKALAVTGSKRSQLMPELPTIGESGLPGYNASGWYGLFAPAATPKPIVARLNQEAVKALRHPDVVRTLSGQGAEPIGNTPEEFAAFVKTEIDKWANLVKVAKMKMD